MNPKLQKLIITGASGFTGQHACEYFSKIGFEVIGITRKSKFNGNGTQIECCDLINKDAVRCLIEKVNPQFLLHLAGQNHVGTSWKDPLSSIEANVMSTLYLIDALRQKNPTCKIVIVGSSLQFNPANLDTLNHPYGVSKTLQVLISQAWALLYNMNIIIAQPSNLIGPGYSNGVCSIFAKKIVEMEKNKAEKFLEVYNPKIQRDFLDVRDAVRAYGTLLQKGEPREIYDISSGKIHSLEEIISIFKSMANVNFELKLLSNNPIEQHPVTKPVKLNILGWKPDISFEKSLNDIFKFYQNQN